jgi:hypothetical protein
LSELVDAVIKQLEYINKAEYRPASYKDFQEFEVEKKWYKTNYNTLRNVISRLKRDGRIERYYNSKASFFVIKGIKFGKHRTNQEITNHSLSQLSDTIQQLPATNRGLHDIHTSFNVLDIWTILNDSRRFGVNEYNKGILLPYFNIDGLKITASIYHTDTVAVTVACSKNPISTNIDDLNGIIRLTNALARTQERMQRIVDESGQSLLGGYEGILIPDFNSWKVTLVHFAVDSPSYSEVKVCSSWKDCEGVFLREYSKGATLRTEQQVHPGITIGDLREMITGNSTPNITRL